MEDDAEINSQSSCETIAKEVMLHYQIIKDIIITDDLKTDINM